MENFWIIAAIVFGGPLLFGGIVRLCITINDVQHAVKLENDPLMAMFLQRMAQGAIRTFYINDSMICCNFSVKKHTKTTTTDTYSGGVLVNQSVREDVSYVAELEGINVVDFESIGHPILSDSHLRQYRNQLIEKLQQCPRIARVDFYEILHLHPLIYLCETKNMVPSKQVTKRFGLSNTNTRQVLLLPSLQARRLDDSAATRQRSKTVYGMAIGCLG